MEIVEWVYFMIARKHKTAALADLSAHNIARCWWEWVEIKRWWLHLWQTEETVLHEHKPLMDEPWMQLRWRYYYYSNFACHCIFLARWVDPSLQRSISSCQNCNLLFCIDRLPWSKHNFMYFIQFHRVLCWMGILSTTNLPSSQRSSAVPTPQSVYKKKNIDKFIKNNHNKISYPIKIHFHISFNVNLSYATFNYRYTNEQCFEINKQPFFLSFNYMGTLRNAIDDQSVLLSYAWTGTSLFCFQHTDQKWFLSNKWIEYYSDISVSYLEFSFFVRTFSNQTLVRLYIYLNNKKLYRDIGFQA